MKNLIYILFATLCISSCNGFAEKDLQLTSPTIEEAEELNRSTGLYVDGIYEVSDIETGLSYHQDYGEKRIYHISYKPTIVAKDFKVLRTAKGIAGKPVIDIELHDEAHERWFLATKRGYENNNPIMIVLDGKVVSAPSLNNGPISGGRLQISSSKSMQEIQQMIKGIKERNPEKKKQ